MADSTFEITQKCYDCKTIKEISLAPLIYEDKLVLGSDGMLHNPNYAISREIFEEDIHRYRVMIGHLMIFLAGVVEKSTDLVFVETNTLKK
jgi:hypothetical protein